MPKPKRNIQNILKCLLKAPLLSTKLIYFGAGCTRSGRRLKIDAAVLGNYAFNLFFWVSLEFTRGLGIDLWTVVKYQSQQNIFELSNLGR